MIDFEPTDRITEMVDGLYAVADELKRGEVLTHEAIRGVLNLNPHEGSWDHVVGKVRRRLQREKGVATWPENTVGYKLCTPAEQLAIPGLRMRRAIRQTRRGRLSVEALPEKLLSLHQRRARAFLADRMRETERGLSRDLKAQAEQVRPTPVVPRRPAPAAAKAAIAKATGVGRD